MTPAQIIALIRDAAIVGALGFIAWKLIAYGEDRVKASDLVAVKRQISQNADQQAEWQKQQEQADAQRTQDMASLGARIDSNQRPVFVRGPASAGAVPDHSTAAASCPAAGGRPDDGPGIDIRASINEFEKRYEGALADCRDVFSQWPLSATH